MQHVGNMGISNWGRIAHSSFGSRDTACFVFRGGLGKVMISMIAADGGYFQMDDFWDVRKNNTTKRWDLDLGLGGLGSIRLQQGSVCWGVLGHNKGHTS